MLLMIDNYDSFIYNLVQYFGELGEDVRTYRNDEITSRADRGAQAGPHLRLARAVQPEGSRHLGGGAAALCRQGPAAGVCLGHQAIGEASRR